MRVDPFRIAVAILTRAPTPGKAKTRLIPALGAEGAARLQRWLLKRTVTMAFNADLGPVILWCAGKLRRCDLPPCVEVDVRPQPEGDLGIRLWMAAWESATQSGVILIGTDCPALTARHLRLAAERLRDHEAVVMSAEDGGYVLIGMRRPIVQAFQAINWGSERVMEQTRERLREAGCNWDEPATLWDVDLPTDLPRLFALCPKAAHALCAEEEA